MSCVLGAGAIGSLYAAKLRRCPRRDGAWRGRDHAAAINRAGLALDRPASRFTRAGRGGRPRSRRIRSRAPIVLLTTKVHANREAAEAIRRRASRADTIVLCIQNGLGSEDTVRSSSGRSTRIGVRRVRAERSTQFGAIFQEPGVIDYTGGRPYRCIETECRRARRSRRAC